MSDASKPKKPVHEIRDGALKVAIWKNEGKYGPEYSLTCRRRYKDKSTDEWKDTYSYGQDDALALAKLLDLAHTWMSWSNSSSGHRRPRDRPSTVAAASERPAAESDARAIAGGPGGHDAQAKEVLGHIYQAMLKTPEFTLQDGTKCRVDPFYEPRAGCRRGPEMRDRRADGGRPPGIHGRPHGLGKVLRQSRGPEGRTQRTGKTTLSRRSSHASAAGSKAFHYSYVAHCDW